MCRICSPASSHLGPEADSLPSMEQPSSFIYFATNFMDNHYHFPLLRTCSFGLDFVFVTQCITSLTYIDINLVLFFLTLLLMTIHDYFFAQPRQARHLGFSWPIILSYCACALFLTYIHIHAAIIANTANTASNTPLSSEIRSRTSILWF